jgi:hypothetical protein
MSNAFPAARASEQSAEPRKMKSLFERYLSLWVVAVHHRRHPARQGRTRDSHKALDGMALYVDGAPVVSIPIAVCLFFMMYPIMVKIDFASVIQAGKQRPAGTADAVRQLGGQALHDVRHSLRLPRRGVPDADR